MFHRSRVLTALASATLVASAALLSAQNPNQDPDSPPAPRPQAQPPAVGGRGQAPASAAPAPSVTLGAQPRTQPGYTITVNKDRLNNALNEPQNWLLMNGDYGSTRYSKLREPSWELLRVRSRHCLSQ